MPGKGKLTADERAGIVEAIKAGGSCRGVAERFGRSPGTVSNIAAAEGLDFDRSQTAKATEAKQADVQARSAELVALMVEDAHRLRAQLWEPAEYVSVTKDGEVVRYTTPRPTFADQRNILTACAIAADKAIAHDRHYNRGEDGLAAVDEWLRGMMGDAVAGASS